MAAEPDREVATLGGGCFWCTEAVFERLKGVERVEPGYSGGHDPAPTYEKVCAGTTGHAEVVQVTFRPSEVSFRELLGVFFGTHDPTTLNRQGADEGTQYRSVIFHHTPEQRETAGSVIRELEEEKVFSRPIVTEVAPFQAFHPAEAYHREYYRRNPDQPYCAVVVEPKVAKLRERFATLLAQ